MPPHDDASASSQRPLRTKSSNKRSASDISGGEDDNELHRASKRARTATASTKPPHAVAGSPSSPIRRRASLLDEQTPDRSETSYWQSWIRQINEAFETAERRLRGARRAHTSLRRHRLPSPISDDEGSLSPGMDGHRVIADLFELAPFDAPGNRLRRLARPGIALQPPKQNHKIWCPPVFDPDWAPAPGGQSAGMGSRANEHRVRSSQHKPPTRQQSAPNPKMNITTKETPPIPLGNGGIVIQQPLRPGRQRQHQRQESAASQGQLPTQERQRNPRQTPPNSEQVRRSTRRRRMDSVFYELDSRGIPQLVSVIALLKRIQISSFS